MRSGLAIEIRIWSKLCGPETCPKMFINSFIEDPSRTTVLRARYARASPATGRLRRPVNSLIPAGYRPSALLQLDIEAKRAQLLDQHVEGFGNAGFEIVIPADNRLVNLGAAGDVVRLDRQHLLQRIGRAVGFERPYLHFAEALTAELRLAAQRLLGDQAVRADRARVDLVVNQVVQLQHVDVAHRHLAVERIARAPVIKRDLARRIETRLLQHRRYVRL